MDNNQTTCFKHFCKICNKGFGCGRALGGHMRAHGIGGDDIRNHDDWDDKFGEDVPLTNKRMYALRTNPNRLKNCRVCENCGMEFLSWKSLLEHGKCKLNDDDDDEEEEEEEYFLSSPKSRSEDGMAKRRCNWSKRKRSLSCNLGHFNSNCGLSEEEDLANCLMMLSNAAVDHLDAELEESCASKEEERLHHINFTSPISFRVPMDNVNNVASKGLFECKACKKVFNSHQALGGHRASHKKVKGCFAARLDHVQDSLVLDQDVITYDQFDRGDVTNHPSTSKRKSKVHECSICHRIFSSGQALGGHKRCHWITSNSPDTPSMAKLQQFQEQIEQVHIRPNVKDVEQLDLKLDLNLPASTNPGIYLQSWLDTEEKGENENNGSLQNVEDEADSKVKLARLSELKDINITGSSSSWLQVGISSTTDIPTDP